MWDRIALFNLGLLTFYVGSFNFYLYELFYGGWTSIQTKAFYYLITSFTLVCLSIQDHLNLFTPISKQCNIICKYVIIINFISIYLTLRGANSSSFFFYYNGLVFAISSIIMILGVKHEIFKQLQDGDTSK